MKEVVPHNARPASAFRFHLLSTLIAASVTAAPLEWPASSGGNGHFYEYVTGTVSWEEARDAAAARTYLGRPGHLVTITSPEENTFVAQSFDAESDRFAWIGASDEAVEGEWRWMVGPEAGMQFANERTPTPPFNFAPWGEMEPNNFDHAGQREHWAGINLGSPTTFDATAFSEWGDTLMRPGNFPGFIVEYSENSESFALSGTSGNTLLSQPFESWSQTPAHWTLVNIGDGTIASSSDPTLAQTGNASLRFNSRNIVLAQTATIKLDLSRLSAATDLSLEFWARRTGSHIGKMELSFSGDGTTWHSIHRETPDLEYRRYALDLDQTLADLGIALDTEVYVRFGHLALIQDLHIDNIRIVRGIDVTGPTITAFGGNAGVPSPPLNSLIFHPSEPVAAGSLSASDLAVWDPLGNPIAVQNVEILTTPGGRSIVSASFADQPLLGTYRFYLPPVLRDQSGNALNQDGDLISGESDDGLSGSIALDTPGLALPAGGAGNVFVEDFENWQTVPDHWRFGSISGGTIGISTDAPHGGAQELRFNSMDIDRPQWGALKFDMTALAGETDLAFEFWSRWAGGHGALFVEFSGDGTAWTGAIRVDHSMGYSRSAIDLDATLANAGIATDADVYVRFRHLGLIQDAFLDDIRITRGIDVLGPRVTGISPTNPGDPRPNQMTVTFDEPMDPSTISAEDFTVLSPWNEPLELVSVSQVGAVTKQTGGASTTSFIVTFVNEELRGILTLRMGSQVADAAGNLLNQDGDAHMGELEDWFVGTFEYAASSLPLAGNPGTTLYAQGFEAWPTPLAHWSFGSIGDGMIGVSELAPRTGLKELRFNPMNAVIPQWATLKLDLSALSGANDLDLEFWARQAVSSHGRVCLDLSGDGGTWTECLLVAPDVSYSRFVLDLDQALTDAGIALDGDVYIRLSHLGLIQDLFIDDLRIARGLDLQGPSVVSWSPTSLPSGSAALNQISVTFSEAIDAATLSAADIQIWDPYGSAIQVDAFMAPQVQPATSASGTTFIASFTDQTARGTYRYRVGPEISDTAGNLMNQNGDLQTGGAGDAFWGTVNYDPTATALSGASGTLFNESFESWPPAASHWGFSAISGGTIMIDTNMPNGGALQLLFDSKDTVAPQYAILKLDLSALFGATDLSVDFWAKRLNSQIGRFCVDVSGDGANWTEVFCARSTIEFQNYAFDLDQALANAQTPADSDVYLRFRHFGLVQDFALDDVRIARLGNGNATITSITSVMGVMQIRFIGEAGVSYRVEVTSDFISWSLVGTAIGEEGEVSVTDTSMSPSSLRFYRVVIGTEAAQAQAQAALRQPEPETPISYPPTLIGSPNSPNGPNRKPIGYRSPSQKRVNWPFFQN